MYYSTQSIMHARQFTPIMHVSEGYEIGEFQYSNA